MNKPHPSDSAVQRKLEIEIIRQLSASLGIPLVPRKLPVGHSYVEVDGYYEDDNRYVLVEAYSRRGSLSSGHKRKIQADILKLILFEAETDKNVEKYLAFIDESSAAFVQGKAWAAKAVDTFGFEIYNASITESQEQELSAAQKRQIEGMRQVKKTIKGVRSIQS